MGYDYNRIYLSVRVYSIAEKYKINKNTVKTIIINYIDYMKERLLNGERIDFFGLVYVEPNVIVNTHRITLGYVCKKIADDIGIPQHTVYIIVREYLESLKEGLAQGKSAEIRGIVTLHALRASDNTLIIHSAISVTIKKYIETNTDCVIDYVRVHTYKGLKDEMLCVS